MENTTQFPDLTKVLKLGDTVYSALHGEGKVREIRSDNTYPFLVNFGKFYDSFNKYGYRAELDKYPCITNIPFNPLTEPFPMPKFTPVVGDVYAFFDDNDLSYGYVVRVFIGFTKDGRFQVSGCSWTNCLPIKEAHAKYMDYLKSQK